MSPFFPPPDEAFAALGDYRDAAERQWQPYVQQADALLEAGEYDSAADAYLALYRRLCSNFPFFLIGIPPIFTDRICRESVTCRHKPEKLRL